MKTGFMMSFSNFAASIAVTIFSSFSMIPEASAQLPDEEGISRPYLFLSVNSSFPMNDFGSQDPFLQNAGFAEIGYGIGMSSCLYTDNSNTFIHLGLDYVGRRSSIWENSLPFIREELEASARGAVLNEIKYRHLPLTAGFGRRVDFAQGNASFLFKGFLGMVYNGISSSSVQVGDDRTTLNFDRSGSIKPCFGGGIGLITKAGIGFDVEYLQVFEGVDFELIESRFGGTETFKIPVSMLNAKLLFALVKP